MDAIKPRNQSGEIKEILSGNIYTTSQVVCENGNVWFFSRAHFICSNWYTNNQMFARMCHNRNTLTTGFVITGATTGATCGVGSVSYQRTWHHP